MLLALIFLSFIAMGLPDAMPGAAWTMMHRSLAVPLSYAGTLAFLIAMGTALSTFLCDRLLHRLGTGKLVAYSTLLIALAMLGYAAAPHFAVLMLLSLPYGMGAGAIDAALNHYVAVHYRAKEMNLLHFSWGIGATLGPLIIGTVLQWRFSWRISFLIVAGLQAALGMVLYVHRGRFLEAAAESEQQRPIGKKDALRLPGAWQSMLIFFLYCGIEALVGLWIATHFVSLHRISADLAAKWASCYFIGISGGRLLCAALPETVRDRHMIASGLTVMLLGCAALLLPLPAQWQAAALLLLGLGCAPIFPCLIHITPIAFPKSYSAPLIGLQMSAAYAGVALAPPLFSLLIPVFHTALLPLTLTLMTLVIALLLAWVAVQRKQGSCR